VADVGVVLGIATCAGVGHDPGRFVLLTSGRGHQRVPADGAPPKPQLQILSLVGINL